MIVVVVIQVEERERQHTYIYIPNCDRYTLFRYHITTTVPSHCVYYTAQYSTYYYYQTNYQLQLFILHSYIHSTYSPTHSKNSTYHTHSTYSPTHTAYSTYNDLLSTAAVLYYSIKTQSSAYVSL